MTERLKRVMENLPASAIVSELNETLRTQTAAIVTAAPGAGKSTVLPLTILEGLLANDAESVQEGKRLHTGKIVVLEPRRVAARQIAGRMAWLMGETVGSTVGYRVRFENKVSAQTRIEVVTEGVLTRMLLDDPALEDVSVVIFDEFHERSLYTDEAFALVRQCQELLRGDLRLVVMSATIDTEQLSETLHCKVLQSQGRMFPVEVKRTAEEADVADVSQLVAKTIVKVHRQHEGDILAFLPGEGEIHRVHELLDGRLGTTRIYPLYGLLSNDEQTKAIAPSGTGERKVVLATPIAETSLTIEGVRVVIDSGLCKRQLFDGRSGLNHLETVRISLDMATQRTGRAGRVAPGVCYRLWSAATEARMAEVRIPEILEADLTSVVLHTAIWGERDPEHLPWLTPPPKAAVAHARRLLTALGATDEQGRATAWGQRLAKLPCHPRIAQMLLAAGTVTHKALAADIAALLEEKDPLAGEGDITLDRRIDELRRERENGTSGRWSRMARTARQYADMARVKVDNTSVNPYDVGALLATAYPERIGKAWHEGVGVFQLSGGELVAVEASDVLAGAEWIVAASLHCKMGDVGRVFMASIVDPADLRSQARERVAIFWDCKAGAVVARKEVRIGVILMESRPLNGNNHEAVQKVVCEAIIKNGTSLLDFSGEVQNMQQRIAFVAARHPELMLPHADAETVCSLAKQWGPFFIGKASTVAELKKIDMCEVVHSLLTYDQQQQLQQLAPTHITVPTGSRIRLEYRLGAEMPVLRVRLQECFGLVDTPLVDGSPVVMELLSPGFKPVQLTSDLRSFWLTTYFEVRKELRRRYPKHSWPDNPLEARPVRGVPRTVNAPQTPS